MVLHLPEGPEPIDWYRIDQILLERHGIRPIEADRMTLSEIALALDEPGPRPHGGRGVPMSIEEIQAEARRWAAMTPKQRLEERRRR